MESVYDDLPQPSAAKPWILTGVVAAVTLILVVAHPYIERMYGPLPPFVLDATDTGGTLIVHWDKLHPVVRRADSAVVEVQDGDKIVRTPLETLDVQTGEFRHQRESGDATLTLTLLRNLKPISIATVRSIGP